MTWWNLFGTCGNVALDVGKRCCICWGLKDLKSCKDFCGRTCLFWAFGFLRVQINMDGPQSVGPQSPLLLPPKWIHLPVPTSTSLKLSTSELTNSWSFMYYKMDFISFIDSWNISSPESSFATKWLLFFFRIKFLALQNEDWFLSSKNQSKKHLLQNDKPGVCNKMHFTSPFFFYQFRVRSHSVVSISSPFLWWKFKGGFTFNIHFQKIARHGDICRYTQYKMMYFIYFMMTLMPWYDIYVDCICLYINIM